jgi:hypothetical protein
VALTRGHIGHGRIIYLKILPMKIINLTMMVSNSTNIIKKNNYLSPQIIEHKEDQDLFVSSNSSHGVCQ